MWEHNNITGRGDFPPVLLNRFRGKAMVLGSGRGVWEDLKGFNPKGWGIVAVNTMGLFYRDRVDHIASLHPDEPNYWRDLRKPYFCDDSPVITHCNAGRNPNADHTWAIEGGNNGTSGLFGVMLALALGYERVVLAGIPLDDSGHFYDPPDKLSGGFRSSFIRSEWIKTSQLFFHDRVRSKSGWTREHLGEPDDQWLRT